MMPPETRRPMGWLVLPCRVLLAGLFLLAAYMKLKDPVTFANAIRAFKIVPESASHLTMLATFVIPWVEAIAGLLLLVGLWTRAAAAAICLGLLVFMAAIGSIIVRNMAGAAIDTKCSCFGKLDWPCPANVGYCQLIRDALMLALAVIVIAWGPGPLAIDRESTR